MEITLFDALKKFFIKDKLILLIIIILSFAVYPYAEKKIFNYKDLDYLIVRIDLNTYESAYPHIREAPVNYLERLQSITHRDRSDRNAEIDRIDCRGFIGSRKHEVDCWFWKQLTKENREDITKKYINYIKEDYKNFLFKIIDAQRLRLLEQKKWYLENIDHYNDMYSSKLLYDIYHKINSYDDLKIKIKSQDTVSMSVKHRIIFDQKNTLYNSILVFVMLCFINFCRVILFN